MTVLTRDDIEVVDSTLAETYRDAALRHAIVIDGYGVRISVNRNHLTITDGLGTHRRTRTLTRAQRTVKRIVILGEAGTISLAAIRWCVDTGVALVNVSTSGRVLAETLGHDPHEARLRRAQALAASTGTGLEVARLLIDEKVRGHATNVAGRFPNEDQVRAELVAAEAKLTTTPDITTLREVEARAAAAYFAAWQRNVRPTFAKRDGTRVPAHWLDGNTRSSRIQTKSRSPRKATDPVNALLNYAYALAEVECRIACFAVGLDPALGVIHADVRQRSSFALDLLESIRPHVEADVLDLLSVRRFRSIDFIETAEGGCRLTEPVTHPLVEAMHGWAKTVAPTAERVAHMIGSTSPTQVRTRTPLTSSRRREANLEAVETRLKPHAHGSDSTLAPKASCAECGALLTGSQKIRCVVCDKTDRVNRMTARGLRGVESRKNAAVDPTQTPEARATRVASQKKTWEARAAWDRAHQGEFFDREKFASEVIPALADVPLERIMSAIGVSVTAASKIRRGATSPHPRHWSALKQLLGSAN